MAKRQIRDDLGISWDVWDVIPSEALGDTIYDRRSSHRARLEESRPQPLLQPELEAGWLCFQQSSERRRFAPIPPAWSELPDGVLRLMLEIATPVAVESTAGREPSAAE